MADLTFGPGGTPAGLLEYLIGRSQLGRELVRGYAQQRRLPLLERSEVELHPRVHLV